MSKFESLLDRVAGSDAPDMADILALLNASGAQTQALYRRADDIRRARMGDGILLRAIVEFSSRCSRDCAYCGLRKAHRQLKRYRMNTAEILASVLEAASSGIKTVVLQSGEDDTLDPFWLADVIRAIKSGTQMAVTLSVGEKPQEVYALWRGAGADRYLLKIETTNPSLYRRLHPDMDFDRRLECLRVLRELGYQTGSGSIVGLPGQTAEDLTQDILFFKRCDFDMIGIGPFIAHPDTPLGLEGDGDIQAVLKVLAVTRIVVNNAHMPATTAVGSLEEDHRLAALKSGANVLMPNFTPQPYRQAYEIYPHKRCLTETSGACVPCMETMASAIGRCVNYSRGDSLKIKV
ncbi:[FeFe]-hydrogenase maturation protein HydE [Candidatus Velamenicoccus archaeovorus]|uniref:[FeFe]-hydrogenase maturation protein HydE n=1 Tax=Velamenicoccus archaeovorus TaxID=1930593 RepID=A0A410P3L6_VELA1|nr:[FeFe] hydrogenase H-cluster radical SAM maturase HydE [Candidatus Velamenicoccus archaeovorus]QAT16594.1 [FeFe]-hydrogenase maturation protein HydE [Candidatus Velamenicoccus archaeovorus]